MRPELSHWHWYEKFSVILLKECPLIEFMPADRKAKISDLLKQVAYEIAGGLRYKVNAARIDTSEPQLPEEDMSINHDALERVKKMAL